MSTFLPNRLLDSSQELFVECFPSVRKDDERPPLERRAYVVSKNVSELYNEPKIYFFQQSIRQHRGDGSGYILYNTSKYIYYICHNWS